MHAQPIIHIEFATADPAANARFYTDVFGWQVAPSATDDSLQFQAAGGPGGAFVGASGAFLFRCAGRFVFPWVIGTDAERRQHPSV